MNVVVEILMRRDNMSEAEAIERVKEVQEMLWDCDGSYDAAETILAEELGLEPDYIMDLI